MKILVADKFEDAGLAGLKACGFDVVYSPDLKEESLRQELEAERPDGLVVRSTVVGAEHMVDSLKLIVRAGAGYNTINVDAAKAKGIKVSNCPGKNADAVAELTFGLILALDRRIPDNVHQLREGKWNKKEFGKARGLKGRTLGVVGFGNIGQCVARLGRAFGMRVLVYSGHASAAELREVGAEKADNDRLAAESDVVSVNCSLTSETRGLCGKGFFDKMKPGAFFVNTSRAEVVDQSALLAAIEAKGIRAGLDVFEGEPTSAEGEYDGEMRFVDRVYCTHHIGASTDQAQDAVAAETVRIFEVFSKTGDAPNCVNC